MTQSSSSPSLGSRAWPSRQLDGRSNSPVKPADTPLPHVRTVQTPSPQRRAHRPQSCGSSARLLGRITSEGHHPDSDLLSPPGRGSSYPSSMPTGASINGTGQGSITFTAVASRTFSGFGDAAADFGSQGGAALGGTSRSPSRNRAMSKTNTGCQDFHSAKTMQRNVVHVAKTWPVLERAGVTSRRSSDCSRTVSIGRESG